MEARSLASRGDGGKKVGKCGNHAQHIVYACIYLSLLCIMNIYNEESTKYLKNS